MQRDPSAKVGQAIGSAADLQRDGVVHVEAEEEDARAAPVGHVGAHVELGEARRAHHGRAPSEAHRLHAEGNHPNERPAFEEVGLERCRYQPAGDVRVEGPVREEELVPALADDPAAGRERPGPVTGGAEASALDQRAARRAQQLNGRGYRRRRSTR